MKRRLIIRPGGIGDTILAFPAMEWLARDAEYTEIWLRSEILPLAPAVQRSAISSTGIDLLGLPGVGAQQGLVERLGSFCEIVSWYGTNRDDFRQAVRGLPFRFLPALPDSSDLHAADFFARQVGAPEPAIPRIEVEAKRHGAVVIHPFSGSARKDWKLSDFVEFGRVTGAEWAATPGGVRFVNLLDLARWLAGASVYIGNDSGITHLAAAVGTPVVALFGPTDPAVWAPRGKRVRIVRGRSMEDIGIDEVLHAVRSLL